MRDNISIIIASIIATVLLVLIPLISILDRQDNMSYNVVLTATTNFVDEVKSKGFIDKKLYEKYLDIIAATGNIYDIKLEAHKKMIYKNSSGETIEDALLYNTREITNDLNTSAGTYELNVGDEFYVSIKNTNTPSSVLMYNFISGDINSKAQKIVNINYGGTINNKDWESYQEMVREGEYYPTIIIGVPNDGENYTIAEKKYIFNTSVSEVNFSIILKNFTNFIDQAGNIVGILTRDIFTSYLDVIGISESNIKLRVDLLSSLANGDYKVDIKLEIINLPMATTDIVIRVLPGLGTYKNKHISTGKQSETFCFTGDETIYDLKIEGPYYHNGRSYDYLGNDIFYIRNINLPYYFSNKEPYFEIKYQNISEDATTVENAIKTNLEFNVAPGEVESASDDRTNNGIYNYGIIKTKIHFENTKNDDCFTKLPTGWLNSHEGNQSSMYKVAIDNTSPSGYIEIYSDIDSHIIIRRK